ncbi:UTRA domain-containing protein [Micromonospora sp. NPDC002575]|uniref:UTRA domain-containing protein n=1 Tax=Micromonospora sp. NPDC002575 TaxID=3364222 RepID=UPI0036B2F17D
MIVVDPSFPLVMRQLRQEQGLSFRRLARVVHYSHTYLWDIETGIKQPTMHVAKDLDKGLRADGRLAGLVTERPKIKQPGRGRALREQPPGEGQAARWGAANASELAQLASRLHEIFVRGRPPLVRLGAVRCPRRAGPSLFQREAAAQGRTAHVECGAAFVRSAPTDIARSLSLEAEDQVLCLENRYYADGEPVQLSQTYLPLKIVGTSEDLGHRTARVREQVTTRFPTREESVVLGLPPGVPVMVVLQTASDVDGMPLELTRIVMRSDLMAIRYAVALDD